jgi:transcription elongation factor GreA
MENTQITLAGLEKLSAELKRLKTEGRAAITERIRDANLAESNAVESADYHDVRDDQAMLERRIALLEERIATAVVVEPDGTNGVVDVGETVRLRDVESGERFEYVLVGALEADPAAGRISIASPLGRALLGRRAGDVAVVEAPRGVRRFEIVSIAGEERRGASGRAPRLAPAAAAEA